jgi:hypothetical protein
MPNGLSVNSRRAQTLIAVREMILRGELAAHKTIEEVELSTKLGASRQSFVQRWKIFIRKDCWKNCPRVDTRLVSSPGRILPMRSRLVERSRVLQPVWQHAESPRAA